MKTITKYSFAEGIAVSWDRHGLLHVAFLHAAGVLPHEVLTKEAWDTLRDEALALFPQAFPGGYVTMNRPTRPFVIAHFPVAAEYFWRGQPNRGQKAIILSQGVIDTQRGRISPADRAELASTKRDSATTITIRARNLDKRSDWKTCK